MCVYRPKWFAFLRTTMYLRRSGNFLRHGTHHAQVSSDGWRWVGEPRVDIDRSVEVSNKELKSEGHWKAISKGKDTHSPENQLWIPPKLWRHMKFLFGHVDLLQPLVFLCVHCDPSNHGIFQVSPQGFARRITHTPNNEAPNKTITRCSRWKFPKDFQVKRPQLPPWKLTNICWKSMVGRWFISFSKTCSLFWGGHSFIFGGIRGCIYYPFVFVVRKIGHARCVHAENSPEQNSDSRGQAPSRWVRCWIACWKARLGRWWWIRRRWENNRK